MLMGFWDPSKAAAAAARVWARETQKKVSELPKVNTVRPTAYRLLFISNFCAMVPPAYK
jgi:hypothetical protein